jgi:hypothetical protein
MSHSVFSLRCAHLTSVIHGFAAAIDQRATSQIGTRTGGEMDERRSSVRTIDRENVITAVGGDWDAAAGNEAARRAARASSGVSRVHRRRGDAADLPAAPAQVRELTPISCPSAATRRAAPPHALKSSRRENAPSSSAACRGGRPPASATRRAERVAPEALVVSCRSVCASAA